MNLWLIFLTGLTTGGLTCAAVQGGLLASAIATQKRQEIAGRDPDTKPQTFDRKDWGPVAAFLVSKLIAYTILGLILGWLGETFTPSKGWSLLFQTAAAVFMFGTAMNLLEVHPIFRWFVIQPPAWLFKRIRALSKKNEAFFAPALLGVLTIAIPCGVTQAMEVQAITSRSPIQGAAILAAFVLGTIPLFALIGIATAKFSEVWRKNFLRFASALLIILSVTSINGVLEVLNFPITWQKISNELSSVGRPPDWYGTESAGTTEVGGVQKLQIQVTSNGYVPRKLRAKAGVPVELELVTNRTYSCALAFTFPSFGIDEMLEPTGTRTVTFTPKKPGKYNYTCGMGMYTGTLEVI